MRKMILKKDAIEIIEESPSVTFLGSDIYGQISKRIVKLDGRVISEEKWIGTGNLKIKLF